jgi:hypothetical protein
MAGTIISGDGRAADGIAPPDPGDPAEPDSPDGPDSPHGSDGPDGSDSPHVAPDGPHAGPRLHRWALPTLPALLRIGLGAALALTFALGAVCAVVPLRTMSGWDGIANQMAPQVEHSAGLYLSLTDMDAQTANILEFGDTPSLAANRAQAVKVYGQDLDAVSRQLQGATKAAGADPAAQAQLVRVLDGLGRYQQDAARATALNDQARAPEGHPTPAALTAYRQATDLMRTALLPAAYRLITADDSAYTRTYDADRATLADLRLAALAVGLAALAALIALQALITLRFRRRINPGLAAATLLCVTVLGTTVAVCGDERESLRYTRHDAFDSVVALSVARAVGYDANADESRALLDPARYDQYATAFLTASQRITHLNGAPGLGSYATDVAAARTAYLGDHADLRFTGYLGDEFRNITFPGERAAAERALAGWTAYQHDDHVTRTDLATDRLGTAIAFNTSYAHGGSNYEFAQWDDAMSADVAVNEHAFTTGAHAGQSELRTDETVLAVCWALALAATVVGVRPRLAEFR